MFKKRTNKKKELKLDNINDKDSDEEVQKQENVSSGNENDAYLAKRDESTHEPSDDLDQQNDQYASKKLKVGINLNEQPGVPKGGLTNDEYDHQDNLDAYRAGHGNFEQMKKLKSDMPEQEDPRDILAKQIKISEKIKAGELDSKVYRGQKGYALYNNMNEENIRASKYTGSIGPIKRQTHFKFSANVDYNPSLCKDYNQTGYCSFGDQCIFHHDRGDYKYGWELEQDWQKEQEKKQRRAYQKFQKRLAKKAENPNAINNSSSDSSSEEVEGYEESGQYEHINEQCLLCGEDYNGPIVTKCEHLFCEACALTHYRTSKSCFQCGKETFGVFNDGKLLLKMAKEEKQILKKKKKESKADKKKGFGGEINHYLKDLSYNKERTSKTGVNLKDDAEIEGAVLVEQSELRNWI